MSLQRRKKLCGVFSEVGLDSTVGLSGPPGLRIIACSMMFASSRTFPYIENDMGRVKREVKLSLSVHPRMINTVHGWWMPEENGAEPHLYGVWSYQINQLIPGPQDSISGFGGGQYKTTLVKLTRIDQNRG